MPPEKTTSPKLRKPKVIKAPGNANKISVERMFEPDESGQTPISRRALDPSPWASNYLASCVQDLPKNKLEEFACLIFLRIANDVVTPSTAYMQRTQHDKIWEDVLRSFNCYVTELNQKFPGSGEAAHNNLLNFARDNYFGHVLNDNHFSNDSHVFSGRITALSPEAKYFTTSALNKIESRGMMPPIQRAKQNQPLVAKPLAEIAPPSPPVSPPITRDLRATSKQVTQGQATTTSAQNLIVDIAKEFCELAVFIGHRQAVNWRYIYRAIIRLLPKPGVRFKPKL